MGISTSNLSAAAAAAADSNVDELGRLLDDGVDVNELSGGDEDGYGLTLLQHAASTGSVESVRLLLARGADVYQWSRGGDPNVTEVVAIQCAAEHGHLACLQALLVAGADNVEGYTNGGDGDKSFILTTALCYACNTPTANTIPIIKTLLGHGASRLPKWHVEREQWRDRRTFRVPHLTGGAEENVTRTIYALQHRLANPDSYAHLPSEEEEEPTDIAVELQYGQELLAWLQSTRGWYTPLHYFCQLEPARTTALLREGARIDARTTPEDDSPLDVALRLSLDQTSMISNSTNLVVAASAAWSVHNQHLWPKACRQRVVTLLVVFQQLAHSGRFAGEENGLKDVMLTHVMPLVIGPRAAYEQAPQAVKGLVTDAIKCAKTRLAHDAVAIQLRTRWSVKPFRGSVNDLVFRSFELLAHCNKTMDSILGPDYYSGPGASVLSVCRALEDRWAQQQESELEVCRAQNEELAIRAAFTGYSFEVQLLDPSLQSVLKTKPLLSGTSGEWTLGRGWVPTNDKRLSRRQLQITVSDDGRVLMQFVGRNTGVVNGQSFEAPVSCSLVWEPGTVVYLLKDAQQENSSIVTGSYPVRLVVPNALPLHAGVQAIVDTWIARGRRDDGPGGSYSRLFDGPYMQEREPVNGQRFFEAIDDEAIDGMDYESDE